MGKKYTYEQVKHLFKNKNIELLSKEYKNSFQKLNYKCLICGHEGTKKLKHLLESSMKNGCKKCHKLFHSKYGIKNVTDYQTSLFLGESYA